MFKIKDYVNILTQILVITLLIFTTQVNTIHAQTWQQKGNDIEGLDGGDFSGISIDLSPDGNIVAIVDGDSIGPARVYEWNGNAWLQKGNEFQGEAPLDQNDFVFPSEMSVVSLSSDGNTVVIGNPDENGVGIQNGHVGIFEWSGNAWQQKGNDIDGEAAGDLSGISVSMSSDGNIVAIGAYGNDGAGAINPGHVRIYEWSGNTWQQKGNDIDGENDGDFSGWSVSLSSDGNIVAIGAYGNDDNGFLSGHVRVYEWSGSTWQQKGNDIDGEAAQDRSGWSVSLNPDGNTVAIGTHALANDNPGHVRVYEWNGSTWQQKGNAIDGEAAGDRSGTSVSLSADGNMVAIGAYSNDDAGDDAGHLRIYEWSANTWQQKGNDIDGEAAGDRSGTSVSLSADGKTVAVSAVLNNSVAGSDAGHVRIFTYCPQITSINTITACDFYTWIDGITYTQNNDSATIILTSSAGCDSIVTLNLTINSSDNSVTNITACDSYTWIDGITYTQNNDSAMVVLTNSAGCDSIITLNLIINHPDSSIINIEACDTYTWIDGITYTESNDSATAILTNVAGCDSIVTLNLIINSIDTSVTNNSPTLISNAIGATYQWVNCTEEVFVLPGEINQSFTVTENGSFAVIVNQANCVDTSQCIMVTVVSVFENDSRNLLTTIYPNPTNDRIQIDFGAKYNDVTISLKNMLGQIVFASNHDELQNIQIEVIGVNGIYFLEIIAKDYPSTIYKVLKQ